MEPWVVRGPVLIITGANTHINSVYCNDRCQSIVLTSAGIESTVSLLLHSFGAHLPPQLTALAPAMRYDGKHKIIPFLLQRPLSALQSVICIICAASRTLDIYPTSSTAQKQGSESQCKAHNWANIQRS